MVAKWKSDATRRMGVGPEGLGPRCWVQPCRSIMPHTVQDVLFNRGFGPVKVELAVEGFLRSWRQKKPKNEKSINVFSHMKAESDQQTETGTKREVNALWWRWSDSHEDHVAGQL